MSFLKELIDNTPLAQHKTITASEFQNAINKMRKRGAFKNGGGYLFTMKYLAEHAVQPQDKTLDGK